MRAARSPRPAETEARNAATSLSTSQLSLPWLAALPGARRRDGAAAPAVVPGEGAQRSAARRAWGAEPAGREAAPRRGLSARSHRLDLGPGPLPPARPPAAAADGTSQPAPRSPHTYPHHPRARRRGRGVARERPVLSLRSSAPESAENPEMAEQREPRSAAAAPPIGRRGRAGGGARRAGAGGGDSGR